MASDRETDALEPQSDPDFIAAQESGLPLDDTPEEVTDPEDLHGMAEDGTPGFPDAERVEPAVPTDGDEVPVEDLP
jgi:hypothetical protein